MSQPVKLSDELVLDARIAGAAQERSIAGQVEFWAKLGRSVELVLEGKQILRLCTTVGATPLADLVESVDTPGGRKMLKTFLESEPYPHFEAHPTQPHVLIRIESNGERTVGRFVNRKFVPMDAKDEQRIDTKNSTRANSRPRHVPGKDSTGSTTGFSSVRSRRSQKPATA